MDKEKIIKRISNSVGVDNILKTLLSIPPRDMQSLLLYVYEQRARSGSILNLVKQMRKNRFVEPSDISQKILARFDHLAYSILPEEFVGVEFSPLVPFGTNSLLAGTNQKNVMSTVRNVEVTADPTTALAFECVRRREDLLKLGIGKDNDVKIATSQRNVRLQNFEKIPGFKAHFKVFALATAGEIRDNISFEKESMTEHISFYLSLLDSLSRNGHTFSDVSVYISDIRIANSLIKQFGLDRKQLGRETQNAKFHLFKQLHIDFPPLTSSVNTLSSNQLKPYKMEKFVKDLLTIEREVIDGLKWKFPNINFLFDLQRIAGIGYYSNLCFKITACDREDDSVPLTDGGFVNWTQKLLNSIKERLLISGIGTEILCQHFLN